MFSRTFGLNVWSVIYVRFDFEKFYDLPFITTEGFCSNLLHTQHYVINNIIIIIVIKWTIRH